MAIFKSYLPSFGAPCLVSAGCADFSPCRHAVGGLQGVHDVVDVVIVLLELAQLLHLVRLLHVLDHCVVLRRHSGRQRYTAVYNVLQSYTALDSVRQR